MRLCLTRLLSMFLVSALVLSLLVQGNSITVAAAEGNGSGGSQEETTFSINAFSANDPSIAVQMYNVDRNTHTDVIKSRLKLMNTGAIAAKLENIKLRYYFTSEDSNVLSYSVESASSQINNTVLTTFVKLEQPIDDVNYYAEIGFDEYAGSLAAGESVELTVNIASSFIQSNDYSYNASATEFVNWNKVTAYYGGALVWGNEISSFVAPSVNYALQGTVTASSALGEAGWAVTNVIDDERRSLDSETIGWGSEPGHEHWLKVDLGETTTINRVDLYAINWLSENRGRNGIVGEGYPVDFVIEVSNDDSSWTTVSTERDVLRPTTARNSY